MPTPVGLLEQSAAVPARVFASVEDAAGDVRTVTYAEELERARATAAALAGLGIGPSDRVHIHLANCLEFFDLWFAAGLLGAVIVPTNPLSTTPELAHFLADSGAVVSVTTTALAGTVRAAYGPGSAAAVIAIDDPGPDGLAARAAPAARTDSPDPLGEHQAAPADVAAVLYTSGTTSLPKGVLVTHANYVAVGVAIAEHLRVTSDDRWLVVLPLFHANAQYYCTMSALVSGASVALAPSFSASRWGSQAERHGATLASLFAAPVRMILLSPPQAGDAANELRAVLFAQNVTDVQAAAFESRFHTRLVQLYGMTETVLPPIINPDSPARRWGSIGQAMPGVEVRLVADGRPVPAGSVGEIQVRAEPGRTVALGYLNQAEATTGTFADGWLRTGDLATADEDGYYMFVDRAKDVVKRSGENIAVTEVDTVVDAHPGVRESAAVGVPDPVRDQAIVVFVVADPTCPPTEDELGDWCREHLAPFKVPSGFVFVDALPKTSVGKINRQTLRDRPDARIDKQLQPQHRA
jgi:crotonobetaine/carnitine-CoA ligase